LTTTEQPTASRLSTARAAPTRTQSADSQATVSSKPATTSVEAVRPEATKTERSQSESVEDRGTRTTRTRHRPGNLPTDIWTQNSSPATSHHPNPTVPTARGGRAVTSGTNLTPLKSLSMNANNKDRGSSREVPQRSPTLESSVASRATKVTAPTNEKPKDEARRDSLDLSMIPPPFSPEPLVDKPDAARETTKLQSRPLPQPPSPKREEDPLSPLVPSAVSSPFMPDAQAHPASRPAPANISKARPAPARSHSKENVSPSRASALPKESLQVPRQSEVPAGGSKRDKEGREVSAERLAAAKARLAARGRQVT